MLVLDVVAGLTLLAALGCGLAAGVFFAFSAFVMRALARLPAAQGIVAMQAINAAAISPLFMTALFGTAALCFALAIAALAAWHKPGSGSLLAGSLLYLGGSILVTIVCNVPRNESLAAVKAADASAMTHWEQFAAGWTRWNHVRAAAALGAAALFTVALAEMW